MRKITKLMPYYWIIQGLLIAISIQGVGHLPLMGGLLLIICTILYEKVDAKYAKGFLILYIIYSVLFMISTFAVFLFSHSSFIPVFLLIIGILNLLLSFIQLKYRK